MSGKPVSANQHQHQDEDDRHHGDECIGHDEAVAQAPDDLFHAAARQANRHHDTRDPSGDSNHQTDGGGGRGVSQHGGQQHQDDECLFDAPELAVKRLQPVGHSNSS